MSEEEYVIKISYMSRNLGIKQLKLIKNEKELIAHLSRALTTIMGCGYKDIEIKIYPNNFKETAR